MPSHATFVAGGHENRSGFAAVRITGIKLIDVARKVEAMPRSGDFSLLFLTGATFGLGFFPGDTFGFFDGWESAACFFSEGFFEIFLRQSLDGC